MKFAALTLAGLVASAAALPNNWGEKNHDDTKKYEEDKHDYSDKKDDHHGLSSFPFHFTSTYYAKATPDTM